MLQIVADVFQHAVGREKDQIVSGLCLNKTENIIGDPLIFPWGASGVFRADIAGNEQQTVGRLERGRRIDRIIILSARKLFPVIIDRKECGRKENGAASTLQIQIQVAGRIHALQMKAECTGTVIIGVNDIFVINRLKHGKEIAEFKIECQNLLEGIAVQWKCGGISRSNVRKSHVIRGICATVKIFF